jgi:hypothetical protein
MLERLRRRLFEPAALRIVFPCDEVPGHFFVADELAGVFVILLLQRQRLVEYEGAGRGEAARRAPQATVSMSSNCYAWRRFTARILAKPYQKSSDACGVRPW